MSEKVKVCELCEEQPAIFLCAECYKCYCDEHNEYVHKMASKKDHKTEAIPKGVRVDAMCPFHKKDHLNLCVCFVKTLKCAAEFAPLRACTKVTKLLKSQKRLKASKRSQQQN